MPYGGDSTAAAFMAAPTHLPRPPPPPPPPPSSSALLSAASRPTTSATSRTFASGNGVASSRPRSQSRFVEGSMSDRASAAPPMEFMTTAGAEAEWGAAGRSREEKTGATSPLRKTGSAGTSGTAASSAGSRFLGPLWDAVRGKLHLGGGGVGQAEAPGGATDQHQQPKAFAFTAGGGGGPIPLAAGAASGSRPSRDEVMQSYQALMANGFFDAHAIRSARHQQQQAGQQPQSPGRRHPRLPPGQHPLPPAPAPATAQAAARMPFLAGRIRNATTEAAIVAPAPVHDDGERPPSRWSTGASALQEQQQQKQPGQRQQQQAANRGGHRRAESATEWRPRPSTTAAALPAAPVPMAGVPTVGPSLLRQSAAESAAAEKRLKRLFQPAADGGAGLPLPHVQSVQLRGTKRAAEGSAPPTPVAANMGAVRSPPGCVSPEKPPAKKLRKSPSRHSVADKPTPGEADGPEHPHRHQPPPVPVLPAALALHSGPRSSTGTTGSSTTANSAVSAATSNASMLVAATGRARLRRQKSRSTVAEQQQQLSRKAAKSRSAARGVVVHHDQREPGEAQHHHQPQMQAQQPQQVVHPTISRQRSKKKAAARRRRESSVSSAGGGGGGGIDCGFMSAAMGSSSGLAGAKNAASSSTAAEPPTPPAGLILAAAAERAPAPFSSTAALITASGTAGLTPGCNFEGAFAHPAAVSRDGGDNYLAAPAAAVHRLHPRSRAAATAAAAGIAASGTNSPLATITNQAQQAGGGGAGNGSGGVAVGSVSGGVPRFGKVVLHHPPAKGACVEGDEENRRPAANQQW